MMDKPEFTIGYSYQDEYIHKRITGHQTWPELIESYVYFLKGIGFQIPDDWAVDFVPPETVEASDD